MLLSEGEIDAAWDSANTVGCDERWWMTLAQARQRDHPADAIPIYQRDVVGSIAKKDKRGYKRAVEAMSRIQRLYDAAGDPSGWTDYVASVVLEHRLKPSLMKLSALRAGSTECNR